MKKKSRKQRQRHTDSLATFFEFDTAVEHLLDDIDARGGKLIGFGSNFSEGHRHFQRLEELAAKADPADLEDSEYKDWITPVPQIDWTELKAWADQPRPISDRKSCPGFGLPPRAPEMRLHAFPQTESSDEAEPAAERAAPAPAASRPESLEWKTVPFDPEALRIPTHPPCRHAVTGCNCNDCRTYRNETQSGDRR